MKTAIESMAEHIQCAWEELRSDEGIARETFSNADQHYDECEQLLRVASLKLDAIEEMARHLGIVLNDPQR